MCAVIDDHLILFSQQFHGAEQGTKMIGAKIVIETGPILPVLLEGYPVFISVVMMYATLQATRHLSGVVRNTSAGTGQFMFFFAPRVYDNFEGFHFLHPMFS
jgi:hypothetical protein